MDSGRISSRELIDTVREKYPKFSKVALCMVRNKDYGVQLSSGAKRYIREKYPDIIKPKKPKKKCLSFYVDDDVYEKAKSDIEKYLKELGNDNR